MEASKLKEILDQHRLWLAGNGGKRAYLSGADLHGANLTGANLTGADLRGADLRGAYLHGAILHGAILTGANLTDANLSCVNLRDADLTNAILPDISWIILGCLAQLNQFAYDFYLEKDRKYENFIQDSIGFFIQDNPIQKTFDILVGDRIIRNIPHWVKYSGMKQLDP
jgi:hypothetical protein